MTSTLMSQQEQQACSSQLSGGTTADASFGNFITQQLTSLPKRLKISCMHENESSVIQISNARGFRSDPKSGRNSKYKSTNNELCYIKFFPTRINIFSYKSKLLLTQKCIFYILKKKGKLNTLSISSLFSSSSYIL